MSGPPLRSIVGRAAPRAQLCISSDGGDEKPREVDRATLQLNGLQLTWSFKLFGHVLEALEIIINELLHCMRILQGYWVAE
jgi:hypothetical protein